MPGETKDSVGPGKSRDPLLWWPRELYTSQGVLHRIPIFEDLLARVPKSGNPMHCKPSAPTNQEIEPKSGRKPSQNKNTKVKYTLFLVPPLLLPPFTFL